MTKDSSLQCFVPCLPGLEAVVAGEIEAAFQQQFRKNILCQTEAGGVTFVGTPKRIYVANLWLRSANRVLLRIGNFDAAQFSQLVRRMSQLPWQDYIGRQTAVSFQISSKKSRLIHTGAILQRAQSGIEKKLGFPIRLAGDDTKAESTQKVFIRLHRDRCTVSIDSSGDHLHRRGYRQAIGKAPLRETLAAGILSLCGWSPEYALIDPFCGSGTIVIEAAMRAANIAPGLNRSFSFQQWPHFQMETWENIRGAAAKAIVSSQASIHGFDRDKGAIEAALGNAERAGVAGMTTFAQQPISELTTNHQRGFLITNPPYGKRIGREKPVRNLYATFGKVCRKRIDNWKIYYLCSQFELAAASGWKTTTPIATFDNGGIKVMLFRGR